MLGCIQDVGVFFESLLFKPVANDLYALLWGTPSENTAQYIQAMKRDT